MGLRCLLGHDYGETRTEREREERGDELVVTVTEVEECSRCGKTRVVSENTEVTSLEHGAGGGVERPAESDDDTAVHTDRLVDSSGGPDESAGTEAGHGESVDAETGPDGLVGTEVGPDGPVDPADAHPPDDVEVVIDEAEPETQQHDDAGHTSTSPASGRESRGTGGGTEQSPEEIAGLDETPDLGGPALGDTSESERSQRRNDAEIIEDDGDDDNTATRDLGEWPESDATHPAAATDEPETGAVGPSDAAPETESRTVEPGDPTTTDDAVSVDEDTTTGDTTDVSAVADEDAEIVGGDDDTEMIGGDEDTEGVGVDEDAEIVGRDEDAEAAGADEDAEIIDADELGEVGSTSESVETDTPAETDFDTDDDAEIIDADAVTEPTDVDAVAGGAETDESPAVEESVGAAARPEPDLDEPDLDEPDRGDTGDAGGTGGDTVETSGVSSDAGGENGVGGSTAGHTGSETESTVAEPSTDSEQAASPDSQTETDDQPVVDDAEIVEGPGGEDAEIVDDTAVEESPAAREARSDIVDEVEPGGEVSPGPESEDAEIVDGDTLSGDSSTSTTVGDETPASADSGWPTHDIEDRGYDAEVGTDDDEDDVTVDGSLHPEVDPGRLGDDDTEFVESTDPDPTIRDTNGSRDGSRDPTARGVDASIGDVASEVSDVVETGSVDSGPSTTGPGVDLSTGRDDVNREYFCPSCGHAEPVGDSSLREGDNCPECMRDYIDERIVE
jgi:hypothetical protein